MLNRSHYSTHDANNRLPLPSFGDSLDHRPLVTSSVFLPSLLFLWFVFVQSLMHKGGLLFYSGLSDSSLVEGLGRGVTCHCLILAQTLMTTQAPNPDDHPSS